MARDDTSSSPLPSSSSSSSLPNHPSSTQHSEHPHRSPEMVLTEKMFFAGAASCVAAASTHPIDTLKTRLQLLSVLVSSQHPFQALHNTTLHPSSLSNALRSLHSTLIGPGGFRGLYRGVSPSLLREATYSSVRLGAYDGFKEGVRNTFTYFNIPHFAFGEKLIAGLCSGVVGASLTTPTDVLKIRMQARMKGGNVAMGELLRQIYREEGMRGLYRGCVANTQRAAILTAAQLSTYDESKRLLIDRLGLMQDGVLAYVAAATMSGCITTLFVSPFDVTKTRIMANVKQWQASHGGQMGTDESTAKRETGGTFRTMRQIVASEGIRGLYRGSVSNILRIAPHTAISFIVYEKLRVWAGLNPM
jgi:solute carrier family 25 protein 14/30